jgi:dolichol-phosphate mannosyltransferase
MVQPLNYSFVIPIFNEEETIPLLYDRLSAMMLTLEGESELLFVDDGSQDQSLKLIRELHQRDHQISYISFARNFGHQIAVTAGLNFAKGEAVIIMDADLQDPPEIVPQMIDKWKSGYQVVYAQRIVRKQETWFKRLTAYLFYRILQLCADDVKIPADTGDFCLLDRQVVNTLNSMPERNRYLRGLRAWVGFNQTSILFERDPRIAGMIKYTFFKSLRLAIDGVISMSKAPLRFSAYLGWVAAAFSIFMMFLTLYWRIISPGSQLIGYAFITIAIFFLSSVQLISIGILGEYIGRIYDEVKQRPLYTVKEVNIH